MKLTSAWALTWVVYRNNNTGHLIYAYYICRYGRMGIQLNITIINTKFTICCHYKLNVVTLSRLKKYILYKLWLSTTRENYRHAYDKFIELLHYLSH